jgi:hypothetical protein
MVQTQKRQKTIKFQSKMPRKSCANRARAANLNLPQRDDSSDSDSEGEGKDKEQEIQGPRVICHWKFGLLFGTIYRHVAEGT